MSRTPTYQHALRLLSRREHAAFELRDKLVAKGHCAADADLALAELQAEGLQSDARYVESMVRVRAEQGKGPRHILHELGQYQVSQDVLHAELYTGAYDWVAIAKRVREQKFGAELPQDLDSRLKQQRFLEYRGFEHEHIRATLNKVS